jgi:hypothetical protein
MKGKRKGKERKGKERKGKERKGKERKGKERKGKNNRYSLCSIEQHLQTLHLDRSRCGEKLWSINISKYQLSTQFF